MTWYKEMAGIMREHEGATVIWNGNLGSNFLKFWKVVCCRYFFFGGGVHVYISYHGKSPVADIV